MTDCPFIQSTTDWLLQQHRLSPLVCRGPESREDGAKRLFPGAQPDQSHRQKMGSTAFTLKTIVPVAATQPADNALSP